MREEIPNTGLHTALDDAITIVKARDRKRKASTSSDHSDLPGEISLMSGILLTYHFINVHFISTRKSSSLAMQKHVFVFLMQLPFASETIVGR